MSWASWTTRGIFTGRSGVETGESGETGASGESGLVLTGELDIHTTWTEDEGLAYVTVQYAGASDWLPLAGSPVPCASEVASRDLHDAVIHAVRAGAARPLGAETPLAGPAAPLRPRPR
ncbi:hypothetical protein AB0D29_13885 [Streptomyces sp. NPDC048424]|uniref:hypothetical protein n=1 Tax=Streptomyces sp. NPDC048424 TaxID=3155265 RepID=UPI0034387A38